MSVLMFSGAAAGSPLSVSCSPINCSDFAQEVSPAEATAQVTLTANNAMDSWAFAKTAGDAAQEGTTASGLQTALTLSATAIGTKSCTYNITGTLATRTVITSVSLTAIMDA